MCSSWRLELFFKTEGELRSKVLPLLRSSAITRVNLTNKAKGDRLLEAVQALKQELPSLEVCVHYSLKWNYERSVDVSFARLEALAQELSLVPGASLLLVSGGGKKKPLDSLKALQLASQRKLFQQLGLPLFVAFNPYFPDPHDRQEEQRRLRAKVLESRGLVKGIYLQMGTDPAKLEDGLDFLQRLQAEVSSPGGSLGKRSSSSGGSSRSLAQQEPLQLLGSVFIPSKRLLAQMKFRPWNGVFLSEEYLGSVEAAEAITERLLDVYARHGVAPLVETAVRCEAELDRVRQLLGVGQPG